MVQDETTLQVDSLERARVAGPPRTTLVIYTGDRVEVVPLPEGAERVLGRAEPADVVVAAPNLSRRHACFRHTAEGVFVEDLGSTNGTHFNGERITSEQRLNPGDTVSLGSVTVSVNETRDRAGLLKGIDGYERFYERLSDEVVRARTFLRGVAVVMVRSLDGDDGHVSGWIDKLTSVLRPVDRMALYGTNAVLIVLPETDRARATKVSTELVQTGDRLVAGVALDGSSAEELIDAARSLARRASSRQRVVVEQHDGVASTEEPLFVSPKMVALGELVDRVAQAKIPVLIQGETGSGKEVIARAIHHRGPRAAGPLRTVNCGAMPASLLEGLLFGHEKGAFTGANKTTPGLFEQAEGGTLFLDEVAELSTAAQVALLRILESRTVVRVGGTEEVEIDVRVVVATHRDLETMVEEGTFRQDLMFRLNPMTIRIPPLRERPEDIDPLVDRFFREATRETGARVQGIDERARAILRDYAWPGNVRELRNVIERAVVVCAAETIGVADLPEKLRGKAGGDVAAALAEEDPDADFKDRVKAYETQLILDALERAEGNQTKAAQLLRMPLRTMVHKIKAYGIRKQFEAE